MYFDPMERTRRKALVSSVASASMICRHPLLKSQYPSPRYCVTVISVAIADILTAVCTP